MQPEWYYVGSLVVAVVAIVGSTIAIRTYGPVNAGRIAREIEREKAKNERKFEVFRRLFVTRGARLHHDHVWALNLIPIEFVGAATVVDTWRAYMENLSLHTPQEKDQLEAFIRERTRKLTALISAMANDLGVNFDRLDIQDYAYFPKVWGDDDDDQRMVRKLVLDLLRGMRPLRVMPMSLAGPPGPFPPAPTPAPKAEPEG